MPMHLPSLNLKPKIVMWGGWRLKVKRLMLPCQPCFSVCERFHIPADYLLILKSKVVMWGGTGDYPI